MAIETIGKDIAKERFTVYLPETTVFQVREFSVKEKKRYSKLVDDALQSYFELQKQALILATFNDRAKS